LILYTPYNSNASLGYYSVCPCKFGATNYDLTDLDALVKGQQQSTILNAGGTYALHRIGDAIASRNIRAAILDAARLATHI